MGNTKPKPMGAKNPRLKISFNEEQKEAHALFHQYDVNFIIGKYGSGKTLAAVGMSILALRKKQCSNITITRPILNNKLGFLPGSLNEKMEPWVAPIVHNFNQCQAASQTQKLRDSGIVSIQPVDFSKGITFVDSVVIVDEFEDLTYSEFKLVLSRLGKGSKMIFCGDPAQTDSKIQDPCFPKIEKLRDSELVGWSELNTNHRNDSLEEIFDYIEK